MMKATSKKDLKRILFLQQEAILPGKTEYDEAMKLARKPDPDLNAVLVLLQEASDKNYPDAHYALATWYLFGKVVKRDYETAVAYLHKCSDVVAKASYDLAVCYEKGKGASKDKVKAFEYYMRSALLGDGQAHYEVGRCFYYGIGAGKNKCLGKLWMDKAGELGYKE